MFILDKKLKKQVFKQVKAKTKQNSCSICFEEFTFDADIRETPCNHIFHDTCLIEWIKKKIEKPDCPFCRAPIKL